ncbi:hypothetical protein [Halorubrum sp. Ea8]|uniref:hypothetical protein n=1 Tax=Halorubrum sp. Ea8 TaxID=1383841 RepID=UPI000B99A959|nr:hypothetical protein [Halorubrum sp. Ea8]OYR48492.1 hypothetical protein DJ74_10435 [Halorubrum sp. Ea8]
MIDERGSDEADYRSGSRPFRLGSLTRYVPGAASNAPKRNVLISLAYLFISSLALGTVLTAL